MSITIKTIRGVAFTNLIILGLVSCSSSPAPWAQADDSPWGTKRASEAQDLPTDEAITDTSFNDPVLLADPEPEFIMQEPEAAPAPEVIIPVVVEELTPEQEIMAMSSSHYAVQVYAGNTKDSVDNFKAKNNLAELTTVKTQRSGSIYYILVDMHPDRATANAAAKTIEASTGTTPWVRSIAGLQKVVVQ